MLKKYSIIVFYVILIFLSDISATLNPGIEHNLNITGSMLGTSGAYIALTDDVESSFYNPAGLNINKWKTEVMLSYLPVWDAQSHYLTGALKYPFENFAFGLGYLNLSSGDIVTREFSPAPTGTMSYHYSLLNLSFSYNIYKNLYAGIRAKAVYQSLYYYNDWGFGADFGFYLNSEEIKEKSGSKISRFAQHISIGLFVKNIIPVKIRLDENADKAPLEINMGFMYSSLDVWYLIIKPLINLNFVEKELDEINTGAEINIKDWFYIWSGFTVYSKRWGMGLGVDFGPTIIDYSISFTPVENIYVFGLKIKF
ncbi:MAG: hypothetical protein KKH98_04785 [Spirochaetes bacterium]|nr:hypothetical protein [Spirochaetota bacterium]